MSPADGRPQFGSCPSTLLGRVRAATGGDRDALEQVLSAVYAPVRDFLASRFDFAYEPEEVCKDLAQETLIRVMRGLSGCRAESEEQFLAWVLTVARNVGLNYLRHRQAEVLILWEDLDRPLGTVPARPEELDDPGATAAQLASRLLAEVLEEVSPTAVELLWARLVEEQPWSAIGNQLGVTPEGAKRRFQRLQARLRRDLLRRIPHLPEEEKRLVLQYLVPPGGSD